VRAPIEEHIAGAGDIGVTPPRDLQVHLHAIREVGKERLADSAGVDDLFGFSQRAAEPARLTRHDDDAVALSGLDHFVHFAATHCQRLLHKDVKAHVGGRNRDWAVFGRGQTQINRLERFRATRLFDRPIGLAETVLACIVLRPGHVLVDEGPDFKQVGELLVSRYVLPGDSAATDQRDFASCTVHGNSPIRLCGIPGK
jgi:hypothetical protein